MRTVHYQALRLVGCVASLVLVTTGSPLWWLAVVPWAVLCLLGILMAMPIAVLAAVGAGAVRANFGNDQVIAGIVFILPTVLALAIAEVLKRRGGATC